MAEAHYDWETNKGIDSRGVRYWKVARPLRQCPEPLGSFRCEREDGHRGVHMFERYRWRTPKAKTALIDGADGWPVRRAMPFS